MLKSLILLSAALLAVAKDDIECSVARFKIETADPPPTTPAAVFSIAEATPTFLAFSHFNVTDACEAPEVTGDAGQEISSYFDAMSSWSKKHECELSSMYAACTGAERYSSQNLDASYWCTSFQEEAAKATCTAESNGNELRAGAVVMGLAGLVAAVMAL